MKKILKKIAVILVVLILVVALGTTGSIVFGIYPSNLRPDLSEISPIKTNVVVVSKDKENGIFNIAKKNPDGSYDSDFKILCFTDLHFDGLNNRIQDTYKWLRYNIEKQKPDLVAFLGDVALCYGNRTRTKEVAEIMEAYGIYWTIILGNHEGESRLEVSREKTMEIYSKYDKCLVNVSVDGVDGFGNQVINILSSDTKVSQSLYFMDSNGVEDDYIQQSQVDWYARTLNATLQNQSDVKSMIFMHIPIYKYSEAVQAVKDGKLKFLWGTQHENPCTSDSDAHDHYLFQKAKELGSTWAFVCGHDHINDFAVEYEGIKLIYNQPSGYSCYSIYSLYKDREPPATEDDNIQGCTLYTVHVGGAVDVEPIINAKQ